MAYTTGSVGPIRTLLGTSSCCYLTDSSKRVNVCAVVGGGSCVGLTKPTGDAYLGSRITVSSKICESAVHTDCNSSVVVFDVL